ncbi:stage II sporulation protein M [Flexivirga caeni]|uniref:Stage II sporulation protein M n=1 Tax=Flexivirga caeni TaxID=2294115 RepID=A0A3M9M9E5_9MICO|nr:stage II sporulation protein M [Flexivirga caeni]RNI22164.1 stage II sporulation protein M [Flexivirga caeni]
MDLDAFVSAHYGEWERLRSLAGRRALTGAEADELLDLYQRVATHLSILRSAAPDPTVLQYLSTVLAKARTASLRRRTLSWSRAGDFVIRELPAVLYRTRWWWITTAAVNVAAALVIGVWVARNPSVQTSFISPGAAQQLVGHDFRHYYSEYGGTDFAARVWTNNVWVAAISIAFGVLGFPIAYVLWNNVVNVGVQGGIMVSYGHGAEFFGLILPHGILELTAVFIAAGCGLRLFWSWVEPGGRTRADAMAHEGRSLVVVALGLIGVLLVSGAIEAFVTPSGLPTVVRVGIGVLAEIIFLTYVFVLGRRAVREGYTGDVTAQDLSAVRPVAG